MILELETEGLAKKLAVLGARAAARLWQEAVQFGFPEASLVLAQRFETREDLREEQK